MAKTRTKKSSPRLDEAKQEQEKQIAARAHILDRLAELRREEAFAIRMLTYPKGPQQSEGVAHALADAGLEPPPKSELKSKRTLADVREDLKNFRQAEVIAARQLRKANQELAAAMSEEQADEIAAVDEDIHAGMRLILSAIASYDQLAEPIFRATGHTPKHSSPIKLTLIRPIAMDWLRANNKTLEEYLQ